MKTVLLTLALAQILAGQYTLADETAAGVRYVVLRDASGGAEISVAPGKGGEMASLRLLHRGRWVETLYRARDYSNQPGWTGKAPFLWPATGRNYRKGSEATEDGRGGAYEWNGRVYPMPIHGFARDLPWKEVSRGERRDEARLTLELADSAATRKFYPFGFRITADYVLRNGSVSIEYSIAAARGNREPMPFSAGNHITFRTPLLDGSDPLAIRFETESTVEYLKDPPGLPNGRSRPLTWAQPIRLADFPAGQAISLGGYAEREARMKLTDPGGLAIVLRHTPDSIPAPPVLCFNVWGDPLQGYFSPEPWVGLQNSFNLNQGLIRVAPGERWWWRIMIEAERH